MTTGADFKCYDPLKNPKAPFCFHQCAKCKEMAKRDFKLNRAKKSKDYYAKKTLKNFLSKSQQL